MSTLGWILWSIAAVLVALLNIAIGYYSSRHARTGSWRKRR